MTKFNAPSNIFKNWKKNIYIATKGNVSHDDYNNEIVEYNKPFYFGKANYQPLTRKDLEAFMQQYGETTNQVVSFLTDYNNLGMFEEFDIAYLYGAYPYIQTTDTKYQENVIYYKKTDDLFKQLAAGVDYTVGNDIETVLYNDEINYGDNANYKIRAYKPQNTKIMVILEEIIKEEN